jgi:hypothetical protein
LGTQGITGLPGTASSTGLQGPQGDTGVQGIPGAASSTGLQGPQGGPLLLLMGGLADQLQ